ncbi:MAG: carbohydrate ABC transporter permease [Oscillospiraceae bacterium]
MNKKDYMNVEISPFYYMGRSLMTFMRWAFLICISFVILYPLIYMLSMSFRSPEDFYDLTVIWIPKNFVLDNFKTIFEAGFLKAMKNTSLISVVSSVLQVFVTALAGYGFARFKFKGNSVMFLIAIFTIVVPSQLLSIPNHMIMKNLDFFGIVQFITGAPSPINLLDTPWSFFVSAILGQGIRAGLFVLVFRQFFTGLPNELEEAAMIDGCGYAHTYFRIMLPNAKTSILVCFLFSLVWYWNDYYTPYVYLTNMRTLPVLLLDLRTSLQNILPIEQQTAHYIIPIEQAACIFSILPLLILFIVAQKYFVQGIDKTGIVG